MQASLVERWRSRLRAAPVMQGVLPVERSRVPVEALAGLTLAALGIPEVLGYAKIAGMPVGRTASSTWEQRAKTAG